MANERLAPDALTTQTNLTGSLANIDEDPDSPDASWLVATGNNVSTTAHVTFPTPTGPLTTGAGLQEFRIQVRKFSSTQTGTPTVIIDLYDNGSLISSSGSTNVTSATGQVVSYTWDATGRTAATVECRVRGIATGGSPGVRNTVDVGAIEWNAEYSTIVTVTGAAALTAQGDLVAAGVPVKLGASALSSSGDLAASGLLLAQAAAALSAEGVLAATSLLDALGAAGLSAEGVLAATATAELFAAAALTAESNLAATGAGLVLGAATLSASANLVAAAVPVVVGSAALSALFAPATTESSTGGGYASPAYARSAYAGSSTETVEGPEGLVIAVGASALTATATLTASATVISIGAASLSAQSNLTATAETFRVGSAALTAETVLTATGLLEAVAGANLSASGTQTTAGEVYVLGAAALSAETSLVVDEDAETGSASLSAETSLVATAERVAVAAAALSATGTLAATATLTAIAAASLSAGSTLVGAGALVWSGAAAFSAQGDLVASGTRVVTGLGLAFWSASTTLTVLGAIPLHAGFAVPSGGSLLVVTGTVVTAAAASLSASATLVAYGAKPVDGASTLSGSGTLVAAGDKARYPAAVAVDAPAWWFDLAESTGNTTAFNKGSRLLFEFSQISGSYSNGTRVASVMPTEVTTAFDTSTNGQMQSFLDSLTGQPLTFEIWKKPEAQPTGALRSLFGTSSNFRLSVGNTSKPKGRVQWRVVGSSTVTIEPSSTADDLVDNGIYHLVATYHPTTGAMQLYINTKLVATGTGPLNAVTSTSSDFQNVNVGATANALDGPTQQAAVYFGILSADRIAEHYLAGTGTAIARPSLSAQTNLVLDGYALTAGATPGQAYLSAQSSLTATATVQAVWVAHTFSGQSNLVATGSVIPGAVPENDDLGEPIHLEGETGEVSFATRGATTYPTRGSGYSDPDVFFTWTAPFTGPVQFRLSPRQWALDNCEMEVYLGYPPDATRLANFDPDVEDPSDWSDYQVWGDNGEVYWPAIEGQTYTILVIDYENSGFPDDFAPTQTEAKLVWKMERIPTSQPTGFGDADFLVSWEYFDDTGGDEDQGLFLQVIRRSESAFSIVGSLRIPVSEAAPDSAGAGGISSVNAIHPISDTSVLLVMDSTWGSFPSPFFAVSTTVLTWDGSTLTKGPITMLVDGKTEATYGVGVWDVTNMGGVTGDGEFYLTPQIYNLENGKTYAKWKYRMASYAINDDGTLTATGQAVDYLTGYDFSGGGDLLAPGIWADPDLPWTPTGYFIDVRYQTLGAREITETFFQRDFSATEEIYGVARLSVADDGSITRHKEHFQFPEAFRTEVDGDFIIAMPDLVPGTRKMAFFGGFYYNDFGEPDDGGVVLVDLDTMSAGPVTKFPTEQIAEYAEAGSNDPYFARIGSVDGRYAITYFKERPGSAYQASVMVHPVSVSGNSLVLEGEPRIIRHMAWTDEVGSSTDAGTLVCVANGTILMGVHEGGLSVNESSGLQGQAITWEEGEGYQVVIPAEEFDGTNTQAVYVVGDIVPISEPLVPNLAGALTGQRKVFGRGKVGL